MKKYITEEVQDGDCFTVLTEGTLLKHHTLRRGSEFKFNHIAAGYCQGCALTTNFDVEQAVCYVVYCHNTNSYKLKMLNLGQHFDLYYQADHSNYYKYQQRLGYTCSISEPIQKPIQNKIPSFKPKCKKIQLNLKVIKPKTIKPCDPIDASFENEIHLSEENEERLKKAFSALILR